MHILVLTIAFLMVAVATIKSFCEKVLTEAKTKAAELKKGGDND